MRRRKGLATHYTELIPEPNSEFTKVILTDAQVISNVSRLLAVAIETKQRLTLNVPTRIEDFSCDYPIVLRQRLHAGNGAPHSPDESATRKEEWFWSKGHHNLCPQSAVCASATIHIPYGIGI
jgi:hypothetical protein